MANNDDWIAWVVSGVLGAIGLAVAAVVSNKPQQNQSQPAQSNVAFNPGTNNPPPKKPGCGCGK